MSEEGFFLLPDLLHEMEQTTTKVEQMGSFVFTVLCVIISDLLIPAHVCDPPMPKKLCEKKKELSGC